LTVPSRQPKGATFGNDLLCVSMHGGLEAPASFVAAVVGEVGTPLCALPGNQACPTARTNAATCKTSFHARRREKPSTALAERDTQPPRPIPIT